MFFDVPFVEAGTPYTAPIYGVVCGGEAEVTATEIVQTQGGVVVSRFPLRKRRTINVIPVATDLQNFIVPVHVKAGGSVAFFQGGQRLNHETRKHDHYMVRVDLKESGTEFVIYYN